MLFISDDQSSTAAYQPTIQHSAIVFSNMIYVYGGFNTRPFNNIQQLALPSDPCTFFTDRDSCLASTGCDWCESQSYSGNGTCYGLDEAPLQTCNNSGNSTALRCNSAFLQKVDCRSFLSCYACFAAFPGTPGSHCRWCIYEGCRQSGTRCTYSSPNEQIQCVDYKCEAASCETCRTDLECMWTRHFKYVTETLRTYQRSDPLFAWNCFRKSLEKSGKYPASDKDMMCPASCSSYKTCHSCMESTGKPATLFRVGSCIFSSFYVVSISHDIL